MSGSPKYNTVSTSAAVNAAIARAAAERERRRAEQQQRRAQAALEKARKKALSRCRAFAQQAADVGAAAVAVGLTTEAHALRSSLARVEADVRQATLKTQLDASVRDIERSAGQIVVLRAAIVARHQADARRAVIEVTHMLEEVPSDSRLRFDNDGYHEVVRLLETARHATTAAQVELLAERVAAHVQLVLAGKADDDQARHDATATVEALAGQLDDLVADAAATNAAFADPDPTRQALAELLVMAGDGSHREALRRAEDIQARLTRMGADLDATIDQMAQRREILRALIQRLPDIGFAVDPDSLQEHPDGSVAVLAQRHSGQHIAVQVEDGGDAGHRVLYMSEDMMQVQATVSDGGAACDALLDIVETMNAAARADGFGTGRIEWDDDRGQRPPPGGARPMTVTSSESRGQAT